MRIVPRPVSTEIRPGGDTPSGRASTQPPTGRWRGPARLVRNRRGSAAIEFAFLAMPFFLILFATIETTIVFLGELTLDQAVERVGRSVRTGEIRQAQLSREEFEARICEGVSFLMDCSKLEVDLATYPDFASIPPPPPGGVLDASGFGYDPIAPETVTALRVFYPWPIHTDMMRAYLSDQPDGSHLLYSLAAFRTEPF